VESKIVHQQLNGPGNTPGLRNMLICYLQYLMDYRRDVPGKDEYALYELHNLLSTKYVKSLPEDDPVCQLLHLSEQLEQADPQRSKNIWTELKNSIYEL